LASYFFCFNFRVLLVSNRASNLIGIIGTFVGIIFAYGFSGNFAAECSIGQMWGVVTIDLIFPVVVTMWIPEILDLSPFSMSGIMLRGT